MADTIRKMFRLFGLETSARKRSVQARKQRTFLLEQLEDRKLFAFGPGNLALLVANASANNTTASIVEINSSTAGNAVDAIAIPGTGADAFRMSGSATSTGYVGLSNDRTFLVFTGANSTNTSANVNTLNPRGVFTVDNARSIAKRTTYTGVSGQQTRSATTLDGSTWFIGDQNGLYTNGATSASPTGNIRGVKSFGGKVYVSHASSSAPQISTVAAATGSSFVGLPGLSSNSNLADYYLIQSGTNGATFDVLYVISSTSATAGTVTKFSLLDTNANATLGDAGDQWTANGSYTTSFGGFGLAAADSGANASLYVSTGNGATTANSVIKLTDAAGYNSSINITTANNLTLFTAPAGQIIKGLDFAPIVANSAPTATNLSTAERFAENTPLNLRDIVISDADGGNVTATLTLSNAAAGTLNVATVGGVTSTFASGVWTASGPIADVNSLLAGLTFTPTTNFKSSFTIATSVSDGIAAAITGTKSVAAIDYTLQLLHLADGEAGLLAATTAPNLAALVDAFDDDYANTLILSGGDNWLPGPFLAGGTDLTVRDELNAVSGSTISLSSGTNHPIAAVDIAILNEIGVEVSTIGNHEFDLGSRVFRDSFTPGSVAGWVGANFVHVSANLDFSGDADLVSRFTNTLDGGTTTLVPEASTLKGRIAPSAVVTKGGEKIGIVGATTQLIESISSPSGTEVIGFPIGAGPNGETDNMALLASQLQPAINELRAEGVDKIVLMSHLQVIANEQLLATLLNGVDIILSAGSNTRLGDANDVAVSFPGHAADFANSYPILTSGTDGKPTLIVNTDNEYTYLGRLVVEFDAAGEILVSGLPDLSTINGAYAATPANVAAAWGVSEANLASTAFADGTKGEEVQDLTDAVQAVIAAKDGNVAGFTNVYLEGERLAVRNQETNLGNLSADANRAALDIALGAAAATTHVVSIKNGGGIRAQIGTVSAPDPVTGNVSFLPPPANPAAGKPANAVSQLDIENALRFNNTLIAFDTTPAGLKSILEHGVAVLGNQGRFPQIGGIAFSYNPAAVAGSRIQNVALIDDADAVVAQVVVGGIVATNAPALITVVTLNFLAQGGDSYPMKANGQNFRYLLDNGTLTVPIDESLDFTAAANVPANVLGEQAAIRNYFQSRYATLANAFNRVDTPVAQDTRIQNLSFRSDTVFITNAAPTAVSFSNTVTSLQENTSTATAIRVADIAITDDALGINELSLGGADAAFFEIVGNQLRLKSGTVLDFEVKTSYSVTVNVNDATVGTTTPDASANFTLSITDMTVTEVDLFNYVRVGRFDLPEPTRTTPPAAGNLLAQEASGVTYNWDTDTLFIVGDGGRSITQVSKTGQFIDAMTLPTGGSPQGTEFYDPEGITYIGGNQFVFTEERDRQLVKFTYVPGTTLTRANAQTVKIGTFVDNIGLEGLSFDPQTNGFVVVKEISPLGIFQTNVDFTAGTATNGSATTVNSTNLFDPALTGLLDFADVYALSNLPSLGGLSQSGNLLALSQESARIINISRSGVISSSLQIVADPGSLLSAANQQHEGITMDRDGFIYVVNENGGGDIDHPQLWVYRPSTVPNQAPTAVSLGNTITQIAENTPTTPPIKVADIFITDDGLGNNIYTLSGADASFFQINNAGLFIKSGTVLDFETKSSYSVTVNVDDATVGGTPDATTNYVLSVTDVVNETPVTPSVIISEVHPSGSGNGSYSADWFEVTNSGTTALDISNWKVDDNSNGTGQIALRTVTSIPAGKSAIFIEGVADGSTDATVLANFSNAWFGSTTPPSGMLIGFYGGGGIGLSTGGDAVNLFDAGGARVTGVSFGPATTGITFDNRNGLGSATLPLPTVSSLSSPRINGAFVSANGQETGSPGITGWLFISEVAPWSSGNSPVGADWFEVTNTSATAVDISGWKMDDNSQSFAGAVALNGITSINPGESVIFIESSNLASITPTFLNNWFGATPPAGLRVGNFSGSGVGLGAGGDQVNLYNSAGALQASVSFGASPTAAPFTTFSNSAGRNNVALTQFSAVGVSGAFVASNSSNEIGSPGTNVNNTAPVAQASSVTTLEDNPKAFAISDFLFSDVESDNFASLTIISLALAAGDTLRLSGVNVAPNQTITRANLVNLVYIPAANGNGAARSSFSFRVNDSAAGTVAASMTINVTPVADLSGIDVQNGQTQRSFVRNLDLIFDSAAGVDDLLGNGRLQLTRFDLSGNNPVVVAVPGAGAGRSVSGNQLKIDFGVQGIGGNRGTNAGDGYYEIAVDLDGNGTFDARMYFFRLFGDMTGNGVVDGNDKVKVLQLQGTASVEGDVNGDGVVTAVDTLLTTRAVGRRINSNLPLND